MNDCTKHYFCLVIHVSRSFCSNLHPQRSNLAQVLHRAAPLLSHWENIQIRDKIQLNLISPLQISWEISHNVCSLDSESPSNQNNWITFPQNEYIYLFHWKYHNGLSYITTSSNVNLKSNASFVFIFQKQSFFCTGVLDTRFEEFNAE